MRSKQAYISILIFCMAICSMSNLAAQESLKKKKKNKSKKEQTNLSNEAALRAERLFFDAEREYIIGGYTEALKLYEQALKTNPNIDVAYYQMAQIKLAQSEYEEAEKYAKKALEKSPENNWYKEYYGEILGVNGKFLEAAHIFSSLREASPEMIDYYFDEAYFFSKGKAYKEAIQVLDLLEEKIGVQEDIIREKEKIYLRTNKIEEAVNELDKLIRKDPENEQYMIMKADLYMVNKQEDKAAEVYRHVLTKNPDNPTATMALADYHLRRNEQEEYLIYTKKAFANTEVPVDAKVAVLYNYIQFFEERKEELNQAYELSDILIQTHPEEAKSYAIAADLRNLNEETEEALTLYEQSLEYQTDIFTVWQQVFFILSDMQAYSKLVEKTSQAIDFFPNQPLVYFFNGMGHQQTKQLELAEKAYLQGLAMLIENPPLEEQFHANLGELYNSQNNHEKSDEHFEAALAINPKNAFVLNNYSYFLSLRDHDLEKAEAMISRANVLIPDNAAFQDTYAWVLYKRGKYEDAKIWQEKALDSAETERPTLLEHYGDILYKLGQIEEAVSYWKKARDAGADSETLSNKIAHKKLYE